MTSYLTCCLYHCPSCHSICIGSAVRLYSSSYSSGLMVIHSLYDFRKNKVIRCFLFLFVVRHDIQSLLNSFNRFSLSYYELKNRN